MRPVYHVASALVAEAQFEALGKQLDRTHTAASLRSLAESLTVLRRGLAPKLAPDPHSTACPPPPLSLTDPDLVRRRCSRWRAIGVCRGSALGRFGVCDHTLYVPTRMRHRPRVPPH
jgi:hypothetical protein